MRPVKRNHIRNKTKKSDISCITKRYQIYCGDCTRGMAKIRENSVDLIFTDPPYGIDGDHLDKHYNREERNVVPGYIEVPNDKYAEFSVEWIKECERILKPGGSIYIMSGYSNLHHILNALHATKLYEVNHMIAHYTFGVFTKKKWVSSHYHLLYWSKNPRSKRTFNTNIFFVDHTDVYRDILDVQSLPRDQKPGKIKNKNQLSESFIEKIILYSSNKGDTVLDPFLGGMTSARAALRNGRKIIGFERNESAFKAFINTLGSIREVPPPVPKKPSAEDLDRRMKQRESFKKTRENRKKNSKGAK